MIILSLGKKLLKWLQETPSFPQNTNIILKCAITSTGSQENGE